MTFNTLKIYDYFFVGIPCYYDSAMRTKGSNNLNDLFRSFAKGEDSRKSEGVKNAVVYTRVSTKEQAENNMSLTTQKKACMNYCEKHGWKVVGEFGGTYESAASDERKEFKRMLDFVKKSHRAVSFIVVYSVDRFSRSGANAIYIASQLTKQGIKIQAVSQPTDTETPSGALQQNIQFIFSEYDNQVRKMKCSAGLKERLLKGLTYGFDPRGYKREYISGKEFRHVLNEEGLLIRKAFQWRAQGKLTSNEIIAKLKAQGMEISSQQLSKIFHNPFYCGLIVNKLLDGQVVEGKHEPCISKEVFLAVNGILEKANNHGWKVDTTNNNLPLKKFMVCDHCGLPLSGYLVHKKGLYYYKCKNNDCKNTKSAKQLHDYFRVWVEPYLLDPKAVKPAQFLLEEIITSYGKDNSENITKYKAQRTELISKIDRLEERFILEEISPELYEKFRVKYIEEKREIEAELLKAEEVSSNHERYLEAFIKVAPKLREIWDKGDFDAKQAIQEMVFPDGMRYNKEKDVVLTPRVNVIFQFSHIIQREIAGKGKGQRHVKMPLPLSAEREGFEPS